MESIHSLKYKKFTFQGIVSPILPNLYVFDCIAPNWSGAKQENFVPNNVAATIPNS